MIINLLYCTPPRPALDDQIEHIHEYFDWVKVHDAMMSLSWTWAMSGGVPTLGDITAHGIDLLYRVEPNNFISCGGFKAENRSGVLSLEFIVADWDAWEMEEMDE